jgi:hypothetical protein
VITTFFASGHAIDVILAVMVLEFAWLAWRAGEGKRRARMAALIFALAPGALLALALRCALIGVAWPAIALLLAASFPFHIADLRRRGF